MKELKPYMIEAVYKWIVNSGEVPYVQVLIDERCQVPMEYAKKAPVGKDHFVEVIVLNISMNSCKNLILNPEGDALTFGATFGGRHLDVIIPFACIVKMWPRDNRGVSIDMDYEPIKEVQAPPEKKTPTLSVVK